MTPFLPLIWHADPPQEIRALLHNLLHAALSLVVILPYFIIAFLQLRPRPRIELTVEQLRPVVRSSRPDRSSYHHAWQMQTVACQARQVLLCTASPLCNFCPMSVPSRRPPVIFSQTSFWSRDTPTLYFRNRAYSKQPTVCLGICYQRLRSSMARCLSLVPLFRLLHLWQPWQRFTACGASYRLPPSLLRFRSTENLSLALPVTHDCGGSDHPAELRRTALGTKLNSSLLSSMSTPMPSIWYASCSSVSAH